jgi:hypothetical protein
LFKKKLPADVDSSLSLSLSLSAVGI